MLRQSRLAATLLAIALACGVPRESQGQGARLAPTLLVRIGSVDGDLPYLFNRISGAVRLSSGEIVVADQSTNEIRWFSPDGVWERTRGREGSGPGEFRALRRLLPLPGDSLLAEDAITARMTLYDGEGRLVRSWRISPDGSASAPPPLGRLPDGSFVAVTERGLTPPPGHVRFKAILLRFRDGTMLDTLAAVRGGETFSVRCGTAESPGVCAIGVPYGTRTLATVIRDMVFVGDGERYELLRMHTRTGQVDTIARQVPEVPLDAARRAYFIDSLTATLPEARRSTVRTLFADAPARRAMPYFDALLSDDSGRLWLARPQGQNSPTRTWDLLDERGRYLGSVVMPSRVRVTHVAHDHVVGIVRDADGVEYVEVYRLAELNDSTG